MTCMGEREVNAVSGRVAIYVPSEWNLDSRFHPLGGFSISRAEFWIPKLSIPDSVRKTVLDSGFREQKFPVIGIQITLHGASPSLNNEGAIFNYQEVSHQLRIICFKTILIYCFPELQIRWPLAGVGHTNWQLSKQNQFGLSGN